MDKDSRQFLRLLEGSLSADYETGNITPLEPGHTTGWRTMGCTLFAQIVGGHGVTEINGRGSFAHPDGAVVVVRAGLHHRGTKLGGDAAVSRWSHVNFRVFSSLDVFSLLEPPVIIHGPAAQDIGDINARLVELSDPPEATLAVAIERHTLLMRLLQTTVALATPAPRSLDLLRAAERLAPALAVIERDLAEPALSVDSLAIASGLSRSRFHELFNAAFAMPPMRFLRRRRLERSCQLLVGSDLSVHAVAERVGFEDQFHFSHAFKRAFGRSPSAYREAIRRAGP